ncbi:MAG: hypothetical protein ACREJX_15205, partial [Polyangiaceae bacterium]
MAAPKILPPRPQQARAAASRSSWPATSPPATRIAPRAIGRFAVAKIPAPPLPSVRIEIREASIESIEASRTDPIDVLFDVMEDLEAAETAVEAGAVCLASLVRAIPSRGGVVHLYDADAHDFVAVYAMGPRSERLILTRTEESDLLIGASLRKHEPIVMS